jgi:Flp pilus assembly protein TadG
MKPVVVRLPARIRSEAGAELVEFALVLPLLLLVFGGIVDFGLLLQRQQVVTNAAREGARLAILPGYTSDDISARVTQFVREGINNPTAAPTTNVRGLGTQEVWLTPGAGPRFRVARVEVLLVDRFRILGPIVSLAGGSGASFRGITLTATSTMRMETTASGS